MPSYRTIQTKIMLGTTLVNSLGALLIFLYLTMLSPVPQGPSSVDPISPFSTAVFIGAIILTFGVAITADGRLQLLAAGWYNRIRSGEPASSVPVDLRRKVLNYPLYHTAISLLMWFLAAAFILVTDFDLSSAVTALNLIGVGGVLTTPLVYFTVELIWRPVITAYFPSGGFSSTRSLRVTVLGRMLLVLVIVGVWPILLLTQVSLTRAYALPGAAHPEAILENLDYAIIFIIGYTLSAGLLTSMLLTRSITRPLSQLQNAMRRVENNDFDVQVPVTSNDELGFLGEHFNQMTAGLRRGEQIRNLLNLYVSPEVAREALEKGATLGGQTVECTVLFSDIRAFTSLSEKMTPAELISKLNEYMSVMIEVVMSNGGFVNKFGGDSLLAVFGTPLNPHPDHAVRAVRTALSMREALVVYNARQTATGRSAVRFGIGIATGDVVAGNVGGRGRLEYTVLGDTVNLAARLQGQSAELGCDILLNTGVYEAAYSIASTGLPTPRKLPPVKIRGKSGPVQVYALDPLPSVSERAQE